MINFFFSVYTTFILYTNTIILNSILSVCLGITYLVFCWKNLKMWEIAGRSEILKSCIKIKS